MARHARGSKSGLENKLCRKGIRRCVSRCDCVPTKGRGWLRACMAAGLAGLRLADACVYAWPPDMCVARLRPV
eukprot:365486-Chlamydomonas_euryale.AAC.7